MIVDGPGDIVRLALRARVQPAHDALQFRKFAHHLRDQVALRQLRRAIGTGHIRLRNAAAEPLLRQPARERTHALDFIAVASEARFVCDRRKLRQIIAKLDLLVRLPEKARIGKSRAQHALVPRPHQPLRDPWARLITARKCGASSPLRDSRAKYFWWSRITVIRISSGSARYAGSKSPTITVGYSFRYVTSSSSSASSCVCSPPRLVSARISVSIFLSRSAGRHNTKFFFNFAS